MAVTLTGQVIDAGTAGNILTSNGAGVLPSFQGLTNTYIGYSVLGWSGTLTTTPTLVSLNTAGNPSFYAYKAGTTIVKMTFVFNNVSGAASTITFQPYGNVTGGATPGNIGTAYTTGSITAGGANQSGVQTESIVLSAGGYVGVLVSASSSITALINVQLWASQVGI